MMLRVLSLAVFIATWMLGSYWAESSCCRDPTRWSKRSLLKRNRARFSLLSQ